MPACSPLADRDPGQVQGTRSEAQPGGKPPSCRAADTALGAGCRDRGRGLWPRAASRGREQTGGGAHSRPRLPHQRVGWCRPGRTPRSSPSAHSRRPMWGLGVPACCPAPRALRATGCQAWGQGVMGQPGVTPLFVLSPPGDMAGGRLGPRRPRGQSGRGGATRPKGPGPRARETPGRAKRVTVFVEACLRRQRDPTSPAPLPAAPCSVHAGLQPVGRVQSLSTAMNVTWPRSPRFTPGFTPSSCSHFSQLVREGRHVFGKHVSQLSDVQRNQGHSARTVTRSVCDHISGSSVLRAFPVQTLHRLSVLLSVSSRTHFPDVRQFLLLRDIQSRRENLQPGVSKRCPTSPCPRGHGVGRGLSALARGSFPCGRGGEDGLRLLKAGNHVHGPPRGRGRQCCVTSASRVLGVFPLGHALPSRRDGSLRPGSSCLHPPPHRA